MQYGYLHTVQLPYRRSDHADRLTFSLQDAPITRIVEHASTYPEHTARAASWCVNN